MNVIFIAIDTLRADHLSCYGYPRKTSPNIDMLAADGVLFENHISCACHTNPAFTSMYTGQDAFHHRIIATLHAVQNETWQRLDDRTPTLPHILYADGWRTYALDNLVHFICFPSWYARGYRYYINVNPPGRQAHVKADEINAEALPLLERIDWSADNFLFIHYWDPHGPYNQPEAFRNIFPRDLSDLPTIKAPDGSDYVQFKGPKVALTEDLRERVCLYDEEIYYCDTRVGQVLEELRRLGVYEDAMIVLVADHGEDMVEHGCWFGHRQPYEGTARVPLIIKFPRGLDGAPQPGTRVSALTTHSDIAPTVLDVAGVPWRYSSQPGHGDGRWALNMDGFSLVGLARGEVERVRDYVIVAGCYFREDGKYKCCEVAVRGETRKLIVRNRVPPGDYDHETLAGLLASPGRGMDWRPFNAAPRVELIDWQADPTELRNLVREEPETARELAEKLEPIFASDLWYGPAVEL